MTPQWTLNLFKRKYTQHSSRESEGLLDVTPRMSQHINAWRNEGNCAQSKDERHTTATNSLSWHHNSNTCSPHYPVHNFVASSAATFDAGARSSSGVYPPAKRTNNLFLLPYETIYHRSPPTAHTQDVCHSTQSLSPVIMLPQTARGLIYLPGPTYSWGP